MQKFSDDSSIVRCINNADKSEYRGLVEDFALWCRENNLQLNIEKTEELVMDFWCAEEPLKPVTIQGEVVEMKSYSYLGVYLNCRLDWTHNTKALYKKGQKKALKKAQVLQCVHQTTGAVLSVNYGQHAFLWCDLLGEQHHCTTH